MHALITITVVCFTLTYTNIVRLRYLPALHMIIMPFVCMQPIHSVQSLYTFVVLLFTFHLFSPAADAADLERPTPPCPGRQRQTHIPVPTPSWPLGM